MTPQTHTDPPLPRSALLAFVAVASVVAVAACPAKPNPNIVTDAEALARRAACEYDAGALPEQTLSTDSPRGTQIPIDHIILLMQENRSFDHYFSALKNGADVASPTITNPDSDGGVVQRFHSSTYCFADTNHSWDGVVGEVDNGKMDGFVLENVDSGPGARAMGYYDDTDIPFYYDLATSFAISDRHFCSAPGDTTPNRLFFAAASARGTTDTPPFPPTVDDKGNPLPNILSVLDAAKVDWTFYTSSTGAGPQLASMAATNPTEFSLDVNKFVGMSQFFSDLDAGTLPSVSWVDIGCCSDPLGNDEHPSADMQIGQHFVQTITQALMASSSWPSSALFITWDEHGGLYDHVPPPAACAPDDYPPIYTDGGLEQGSFKTLGIRVGLLAVSPYAKRNYVTHVVTDHTSLLRFIEARFNLPAMTRRDANATPPFDMFDFSAPDLSIPTLRPAVIDPPDAHGC